MFDPTPAYLLQSRERDIAIAEILESVPVDSPLEFAAFHAVTKRMLADVVEMTGRTEE